MLTEYYMGKRNIAYAWYVSCLDQLSWTTYELKYLKNISVPNMIIIIIYMAVLQTI